MDLDLRSLVTRRMKELNLTRAKLADRARVPRKTLYDWLDRRIRDGKVVGETINSGALERLFAAMGLVVAPKDQVRKVEHRPADVERLKPAHARVAGSLRRDLQKYRDWNQLLHRRLDEYRSKYNSLAARVGERKLRVRLPANPS
jgi:hypothetical protein